MLDKIMAALLVGTLLPSEYKAAGSLLLLGLFTYSKWGNYIRLIARIGHFEGAEKVRALLEIDDDVNPQLLFNQIGMSRAQFLKLVEKLKGNMLSHKFYQIY